jgi:hypothetical protein
MAVKMAGSQTWYSIVAWNMGSLHATLYRKLEKNSQKGNCAASVLFSTFIYLWAIYLFPRSVCLFGCRKIGGSIIVVYKWEYGPTIPHWLWNMGPMQYLSLGHRNMGPYHTGFGIWSSYLSLWHRNMGPHPPLALEYGTHVSVLSHRNIGPHPCH